MIVTWWSDSSSDSDKSEQKDEISIMALEEKVEVSSALLTLMVDIDESEEKLTTLHNIKEILEEYSLGKIRSLASVLIDS